MRKFLELLFFITSSWKNFLLTTFVTFGIAYYSISFNSDLPKPETFIELAKFLWSNSGPYLFGMILNLLASLLSITLSSSLFYFLLGNYKEYRPIVLIIVGLIGLTIFIVSFYFLHYFFLLLVTLILIGLIVFFVFQSLAESR